MSSSVRVGFDSDIERSCARKRRYGSKAAAKAAAKGLHRAGGRGDSSVYPCDHCRGWHIARRRSSRR